MLTPDQAESGHYMTRDGRVIFVICNRCGGLLIRCPDPACDEEFHHDTSANSLTDDFYLDGTKPLETVLDQIVGDVFGRPIQKRCYFSIWIADKTAYTEIEYDSIEQAQEEAEGYADYCRMMEDYIKT